MAIGLLWRQPAARIGVNRAAHAEKDAAAPPGIRISASHQLGIIGVTLGLAALQLNMVLLPLIIMRDLSGSLTQVGIAASFAAAIEVPVMIGWGYLAMRMRKDVILAIASMTFALYFVLMFFVSSFFQVLVFQGVAAVSIAALLSINISYLQDTIPGRVGLATSLVDVTRVVSVFTAAAVFSLNTGATYTPLMAVAAGLCLCGGVLMLLAVRARRFG